MHHSQVVVPLLVVATSLLFVDACSDSKQVVTTTTIGMEGGTTELGDDVEIDIPPGALPGDEEIGLEEVPPTAVEAAPEGASFTDDVFAMTPHGLIFNQPVSVTIAYTGADTNRVVLRLDNKEDTTWEVVPGADFASGKATFETMTFSVYGVADAEPCVDDNGTPTADAGIPMIPTPDAAPAVTGPQRIAGCPDDMPTPTVDAGVPVPAPDAALP
jgi:hypothetical protein